MVIVATNILMAPADYIVSDELGSEYTRVYNLIQKLSGRGVKVTALVGYDMTGIRIHGAHLVKAFPSDKDRRPFRDALNRLSFVSRYWRTAHEVLQTEDIELIHHVAPLERRTFNLLALDGTTERYPFIVGPAQPFQRQDYFDGFIHWMNVRPGLDARMVSELGRVYGPFFHHLFKQTIRRCNLLVCASEMARSDYSRFLEPQRMMTIPNAVDTSLFGLAKFMGRKANPTILTVCKLIRRKGVDQIIQAMPTLMRRYPELRLRIIGDGPNYQDLSSLAAKLGVKRNIEFLGRIPHRRLPEYYGDCDVFCFAPFSDPMPNAVLEAMACGKPVVATGVGSLPEIITTGKNGIIVSPGDVRGLTNALLQLVEDVEARRKMGSNAFSTIRRRFSWEVVVDSYIRAYDTTPSGWRR